MNFGATDSGILGPAFLAGVLVILTHVPLGIQVLARGIVFIDLAIAQVAGLGVIFADWLGLTPQLESRFREAFPDGVVKLRYLVPR